MRVIAVGVEGVHLLRDRHCILVTFDRESPPDFGAAQMEIGRTRFPVRVVARGNFGRLPAVTLEGSYAAIEAAVKVFPADGQINLISGTTEELGLQSP